jgi:SAM-dependent methyltransferase
MTTTKRWARAQQYEQGFWQSIAEEIAQDSVERIDFYRWRAGELEKRLRRLGLDNLLDGSSRILELGSGPIGVIGYLPGRDRVAVDPLNRFYATSEHLTRLRNPEVRYLDSPGEEIPLTTGGYQLVVMENCIDHTQDPEQVMSEIVRLLVPGGTLYMTVNARSRLGYWVHRLLARLELDPGHPHTFTAKRFENFVSRHGFEIREFEVGSWWAAWKGDLWGKSLRAKAKGVLLVSEHLLSCVATKSPNGGDPPNVPRVPG